MKSDAGLDLCRSEFPTRPLSAWGRAASALARIDSSYFAAPSSMAFSELPGEDGQSVGAILHADQSSDANNRHN